MTPLRREERLRLERKVHDISMQLPKLRAEMALADAFWRCEAEKPAHLCDDVVYEKACDAASKLALRIEDEERDLDEALSLLADNDRSADFASWARERGAR